MLRGACQLAITLLANVAGEPQFKVHVAKAYFDVAGGCLVLVATDWAFVAVQKAAFFEIAHVDLGFAGRTPLLFGQFLFV